MVTFRFCLAAVALFSSALAIPQPQHPAQQIFDHLERHVNPLKHLSAISPFYIPSQKPSPLPTDKNGNQCSLKRVSLLIRHSSILGNDDEYEQTMGPFIQKIKGLRTNKSDALPSEGDWKFLRDWESPIVEEKLEVLSENGRKDAKRLGKYIRKQYNTLFPPKSRKPKGVVDGKRPSYKVWTASSSRDIESAQAYILGAFPSHQSGDDGHGDGEVVQLVKVPNKAKDWDRSLTPHKACDAFEKDSSLGPANKWLDIYAPRVIARIATLAPELASRLVNQDILAMQMLCGYETIASDSSPFCSVFTDSEWLDFEYQQDIRFHYMLGYGQSLSPYLGLPWVRTALHLLAGKDGDEGETHGVDEPAADWRGDVGMQKKNRGDEEPEPLPKPRVPPNATHTQLLHASFTHRESPGFVAVFLNLFNDTSLSTPIAASLPPPLDHRPSNRAWRTSHLVPLLGHIALERFHCGPDDHDLRPVEESKRSWSLAGRLKREKSKKHQHRGEDYVRAVVNGRHEVMTGCEDGVERSCRWKTFEKFVEQRAERWGDWASVCVK